MSDFIKRCERASEETGVDIIDTYDDGGNPKIYEDDGILHVIEGNERVAFDVGECQNLSRKAQNANTRAVLKALGKEVPNEAIR